MRISTTRKTILKVLEAGEVAMLVGHAGVGKTSLIRQIGRETGRKVITLILSQMEPGDLLGLPKISGERTEFLKPDWWPTDPNTILFLDEINRANMLVRNAVMQLLIDKRIHNHVLPKGVWIAAAMNPADGYDVFDVSDPAFVDRFVWIRVEDSEEDFLEYIRKSGLFLAGLEEVVRGTLNGKKISLPKISPTPRAWERALRVARKLERKDIEEFGYELFSGIIGEEAASRFVDLLLSGREELNVGEIPNLDRSERLKMLPKLSGLILNDPDSYFDLLEKLPPEESAALLRRSVSRFGEKTKKEISKRKKFLRKLVREILSRRVV